MTCRRQKNLRWDNIRDMQVSLPDSCISNSEDVWQHSYKAFLFKYRCMLHHGELTPVKKPLQLPMLWEAFWLTLRPLIWSQLSLSQTDDRTLWSGLELRQFHHQIHQTWVYRQVPLVVLLHPCLYPPLQPPLHHLPPYPLHLHHLHHPLGPLTQIQINLADCWLCQKRLIMVL